MTGDVQAAKPAPSRLHSKVADGSLDENVNVAVALATVPVGPESIDVSGGEPLVTLTVHGARRGRRVDVAGRVDRLDRNVCAPFARRE